MDVELKSLIFGKKDVKRLVSCEPNDGTIELFFEDANGNVHSEIKPHKYWMLSQYPQDKTWVRLKGDAHYKYMRKYDTLAQFMADKKQLYKYRPYCIYDAKEAAMVLYGFSYFHDMKFNEPSVLSFDIESSGLIQDDTSRVFIIANTFRKNGVITRKMFTYEQYENDGEMIAAWCDWVREINPSFMIGFNILGYDLLYLSHVAGMYNISLSLGRDGSDLSFNSYESKFRVDGTRNLHYHKVKVYGREVIDCMFLAVKYDAVEKKYESYALKSIIKHEGLEAADRQHYDAATIRDNYCIPEEWEKIKRYAEFDGDDALKIYDLMGESFFYMTQSVPKSFQGVTESASGSQINSILVRSYLQYGYSIPQATEVGQFRGGISFGIPGIYRNAWKLDIKSCYPSAILINKLYSHAKDPNAHMYKLCEYFTLQRFEYKRLLKATGDSYYKALDGMAKVFINSMFGFCSAPGLNFNDPKVAAIITQYGRKYLSDGMVWATNKPAEYWEALGNTEDETTHAE